MMKPHSLLTLVFLWMLALPLQANDASETPLSKSVDSPLVSDLSVEQFSEVVKAIVQQTLFGEVSEHARVTQKRFTPRQTQSLFGFFSLRNLSTTKRK